MALKETPRGKDLPLPKDYRPQNGTPYKVQDGDDWVKIAKRRGIKVWELIYFNFKTTNPREVNFYLERNVGCPEAPDKKNYMFSSSSAPGIIYIPAKDTGIIDVVDATVAFDEREVRVISSSGLNPIVLKSMSGAVEYMVQQIKARVRVQGFITLLRFHGHGASGGINLAAGQEDFDEHHSGFSNVNWISVSASLAQLRPYFASQGRVELHGCNVAQGAAGLLFLRRLAKIWRVPVSAGEEKQYAGNEFNQFVFEGPVYTVLPNGVMMSGIP
jgi:hypothetical protein